MRGGSRLTNMERIGKWPIEGAEARNRKRMILIHPDQSLKVIHGKHNHTLVSFFVSNDYVHFGTMTIPVGRYSDPETHKGDEVVFVLEGTLVVQVFDDTKKDEETVLRECYEVREHEKFLIPEGYRHRYLNFAGKVVRFLFGIAPEV